MLARGAAPALKTLGLEGNNIGDEGMRHLGDALARGAAPALKELRLRGDTISDEGLLKQGKRHYLDGAFLVAHLADAKELNCIDLGWGDEEARRFAAALEHATAHGALKALEGLSFAMNKIGDEGMRHLGDALARGAVPALQKLALDMNDENPASDAAKKAVKDALKNRGGH